VSSEYKNASKDQILSKLKELDQDSSSLNKPILQKDSFWIYANARRYCGSYRAALSEVGLCISDNLPILSETGYQCDWWPFINNFLRKDWLGLVLEDLHNRGADLRPVSLKKSNYFDIYVDSCLFFGKYDKAFEYIDKEIPSENNHIDIASLEPHISQVISIYTDPDNANRNEIFNKLSVSERLDNTVLDDAITQCRVIVDGSNIVFSRKLKDKPLWENICLVDQYLQDQGFERNKISFFFDANIDHVINISDFPSKLEKDHRLCCVPAGEKADGHILAKAKEYYNQEPNFPPFIISNDRFKDYESHDSLKEIVPRRRGVTWTYRLKKPEPLINFLYH